MQIKKNVVQLKYLGQSFVLQTHSLKIFLEFKDENNQMRTTNQSSLPTILFFVFSVLAQPILAQTNYLIEFQTGDLSGDGHALTTNYLVSSSANMGTLKKLLKIGNKKIGFDLDKEVQEYEDNSVTEANTKKLDKWFSALVQNIERSDQGELLLDRDLYLELTMAILKLANPDLQLVRVQVNMIVPPSLYEGVFNIGGYGLYSP